MWEMQGLGLLTGQCRSDLVGEICMEAFVRPLQQDAKYIDTLGMHTREKWPTS